MRITEEQLVFLSKFSCERLSDSPDNQELIKEFYSDRGSGLVSYLMANGWREDITGETAFYIIKGYDGKPWLFFSLQCGALYDLFNKNEVENKINWLTTVLQSDNTNKLSVDDRNNILEITRRANGVIFSYNEDIHKEGNRPILRVGTTYPSVEIVQFCVDDNKKKMWNEQRNQYGIRFSMGQVFFWRFIVERIEMIRNLIGCQYVHLYAADTSLDETLLGYYEDSLKFIRPDEKFGITKPIYDYTSIFMIQEIKDLLMHRDQFFDSFNIDIDEDVV